MRMTLSTEGIFLGATRTDYTRKSDGKSACYYSISIKQGAEVGTIPCSEDVFRAYDAGVLQDFQKVKLCAVYNDQYSRMSVTDVQVIK